MSSISPTTTTVAMHMSDGIINAPTSALFGVVALAGLAICAWRARSDLDEKAVPMAGLVAAFIFAVQMINFPILPGVSGHLLGGALAAILVGPYTGALCIAIVLVVQALLFADGGVTALGANITNMALISTFAGYLVAVVLVRLIRARPLPTGGLAAIAFVSACAEQSVRPRDSWWSTHSVVPPPRRWEPSRCTCGAPTSSSAWGRA